MACNACNLESEITRPALCPTFQLASKHAQDKSIEEQVTKRQRLIGPKCTLVGLAGQRRAMLLAADGRSRLDPDPEANPHMECLPMHWC